MHFAHPPFSLPLGEYRRLQRLMLTMIGSRTALASVLRHKLGSADPVPAKLAPEVAVSGKRVRFKINGRDIEERTLTWEPAGQDDGTTLSLLSPRGLALLGLGPGDTASYRTERDRTEFLEVERVSALERRREPPATAAPLPRHIPHLATTHFSAPAGAIAGDQHV